MNNDPFDRTLQKKLLEEMRDKFPRRVHNFQNIPENIVLYKNLQYLEGHGLCEARLQFGDAGYVLWKGATITSKGLDFISDDGGLSAILGVVNVRIHAETIRALLSVKLSQSEVPAEQKSKIMKMIESLPEASIKALTNDLIQNGINHIPNLIEWLRGFSQTL